MKTFIQRLNESAVGFTDKIFEVINKDEKTNQISRLIVRNYDNETLEFYITINNKNLFGGVDIKDGKLDKLVSKIESNKGFVEYDPTDHQWRTEFIFKGHTATIQVANNDKVAKFTLSNKQLDKLIANLKDIQK